MVCWSSLRFFSPRLGQSITYEVSRFRSNLLGRRLVCVLGNVSMRTTVESKVRMSYQLS